MKTSLSPRRMEIGKAYFRGNFERDFAARRAERLPGAGGWGKPEQGKKTPVVLNLPFYIKLSGRGTNAASFSNSSNGESRKSMSIQRLISVRS